MRCYNWQLRSERFLQIVLKIALFLFFYHSFSVIGTTFNPYQDCYSIPKNGCEYNKSSLLCQIRHLAKYYYLVNKIIIINKIFIIHEINYNIRYFGAKLICFNKKPDFIFRSVLKINLFFDILYTKPM